MDIPEKQVFKIGDRVAIIIIQRTNLTTRSKLLLFPKLFAIDQKTTEKEDAITNQ